MRENFAETAETILRLRVHKDALVRRAVVTLIPTLAIYDTQTFSEHFLHMCMGHLLTQLSKGQAQDRSQGVCSHFLGE